MIDDGDTSTKERGSEADESVAVTVSGVSADGTSDSGGQSTVEARGDTGGEASANSPIQTARELLQKVVRWVRKILRFNPRRNAQRASVSVLRDRKHKH